MNTSHKLSAEAEALSIESELGDNMQSHFHLLEVGCRKKALKIHPASEKQVSVQWLNLMSGFPHLCWSISPKYNIRKMQLLDIEQQTEYYVHPNIIL